MDTKCDVYRMAEDYWSVAGQQFCVLGIVPVCRELIRRSYEDGAAFDREGFGGLEPCLESLIGEFLAGTIQKTFPYFGGAERHDGQPDRFMWKSQTNLIRAGSVGLTYLQCSDSFTGSVQHPDLLVSGASFNGQAYLPSPQQAPHPYTRLQVAYGY